MAREIRVICTSELIGEGDVAFSAAGGCIYIYGITPGRQADYTPEGKEDTRWEKYGSISSVRNTTPRST